MDSENYLSSSENVAQLQRLYRITEGDRRAYGRDTEVTLLRQRKIIHKLEAEREKILSQVSAFDEGTVGCVSDLNAMLDVYKQKRLLLYQERQIVQSQMTEMQILEKEIGKLIIRKGKEGKFSSKQQDSEPVNTTTKRIEILEDRLQNASVHYNQLLYDGGRLRGDIEGLLKQRNVHRSILKRLGRRMSEVKAQMEALADDAIRNYNAREVAYQKLQVLKGDHLVDDQLCKSQVQEAQRVLELQKTLFEFVATKTRRRTTATTGRSTPRRPDRSPQMAGHGDRRRSEKDVAIGDTELFTYASNLNNKVEELQSEIDDLLKECHMLESIRTQQDDEQKNTVKDLEELLVDLRGQCGDAQIQKVGQEKIFGKLKSNVDVMLRAVGRHPVIVELAVDDDSGMFKPAIMKAIKNVEGSVDELLRNKHFSNKQNGELDVKMTPSPTSLTKRGPTKAEFQSICVSHPSFDIMITPPELALPEEADLHQVDVDGQLNTLVDLLVKSGGESVATNEDILMADNSLVEEASLNPV